MSDVRIKADQLLDVVQKELSDYADVASEDVKKAVQETADSVVQELKANSPKRTGKYARSWRQRKVTENANELGITVFAGRYQLTHLLENGHAKRGGGRVRAIPHIKPAEEHGAEKVEKAIRQSLGGSS